MKPIEPGCLVVCVAGHLENVGKTARVIRFIGSKPLVRQDNLWLTDREWVYLNRAKDDAPVMLPCAPENALLRIDGYTETETEEQEATA